MRTFRLTLAAAGVALALAASNAAAQFSNAFFFGDSLTDSGSYKPVLPPGTGLFTTNPGPVWSQLVAQRYGFVAIPANQGGTNFAQGGARVVGVPGFPNQPPTANATPIATQVAQLVGSGPLDSGALYSVWGGANDIFVQLGALSAGTINSVQLQVNVATAASDLVRQVGVLQAAGARNIIVLNLPDIGRTPFGLNSGQPAQLTAISSLFNTTLQGGLDALGGSTIRVNIFSLLNEVTSNPAAYGFVNATLPACGTTPSLLCTSGNLISPSAATTFVFADGVHPTTGAHAIVAQAVESMIEGPAQIGSLAEAPLAVEEAIFRSIDARMISGVNAPRATNRYDAWVNYDYGNNDLNGSFLSGDGDTNTIAAGVDIKVTDQLLVGVAFGYSEDRAGFGGNAGGFKLKEASGTLYGGYGVGPWYVGATLGAGDLDYSDVHRNIALGALTRSENADARGWHAFGSVLGGYWFTWSDWVHGPFARVSYEKVHVKAFSERGSDSTALSYGEQERKSLITSLGWQVSGRIANVRPFARVTWDIESKDDARSVSASSVTLDGNYSVPTIKPDKDWARFVLGAAADFTGFTGYIVGEATSGRSDANGYGVTVGVRVPL